MPHSDLNDNMTIYRQSYYIQNIANYIITFGV